MHYFKALFYRNTTYSHYVMNIWDISICYLNVSLISHKERTGVEKIDMNDLYKYGELTINNAAAAHIFDKAAMNFWSTELKSYPFEIHDKNS